MHSPILSIIRSGRSSVAKVVGLAWAVADALQSPRAFLELGWFRVFVDLLLCSIVENKMIWDRVAFMTSSSTRQTGQCNAAMGTAVARLIHPR